MTRSRYAVGPYTPVDSSSFVKLGKYSTKVAIFTMTSAEITMATKSCHHKCRQGSVTPPTQHCRVLFGSKFEFTICHHFLMNWQFMLSGTICGTTCSSSRTCAFHQVYPSRQFAEYTMPLPTQMALYTQPSTSHCYIWRKLVPSIVVMKSWSDLSLAVSIEQLCHCVHCQLFGLLSSLVH